MNASETRPTFAQEGLAEEGSAPAEPAKESAVQHIVDLTVASAVTRTERLFAGMRAAFCAAGCALFFLTGDATVPNFWTRALWEASTLAAGVGVSLWIFLRLRRTQASKGLLLASVSADALLATSALASNTFAPYPGYPGILETPDIAIVPLIVTSSIFRALPLAVWCSTAVSVAGIAVLVLLDQRLGIAIASNKLLLVGLYLCAATAVALFATARVREIFARVGRAVVQAEGARGGVFALLQDHHDLRSVLCDLQLQADRLAEARRIAAEPDASVNRFEELLQRSIEQLAEKSVRTRDRALTALAGLGPATPANTAFALEAARSRLAERFAGSLSIGLPEAGPVVLFGNGTEGLTALFEHLFVNAREGDGQRGATRVEARVRSDRSGYAQIVLEDDGPGFSESMLENAARSHGSSTKRGSAGIGLWLSRATVVATGGELELANTARGARVTIRVPLAPE